MQIIEELFESTRKGLEVNEAYFWRRLSNTAAALVAVRYSFIGESPMGGRRELVRNLLNNTVTLAAATGRERKEFVCALETFASLSVQRERIRNAQIGLPLVEAEKECEAAGGALVRCVAQMSMVDAFRNRLMFYSVAELFFAAGLLEQLLVPQGTPYIKVDTVRGGMEVPHAAA